jgi:hypothetical protein
MKAKRYDMGGSVSGGTPNPSPLLSINAPDNSTPAQKTGFLSVAPPVGMKKGGSVKGVRGGGIESKGRTKGRFV